MQALDSDGSTLTDSESWATIHATVDDARRSMYVAGSTAILLLWAAITGLAFITQYAIAELATGFAERSPWFPLAPWSVLGPLGGWASAIIGRRARQRIGVGDAARKVEIRFVLFWLAVVTASFLIPLAAGVGNVDVAERGARIMLVVVGIWTLALILFGIMHRPLIAAGGAVYAAAFYIPFYLAGDIAPAISGATLLAVAAGALAWIAKKRVGG